MLLLRVFSISLFFFCKRYVCVVLFAILADMQVYLIYVYEMWVLFAILADEQVYYMCMRCGFYLRYSPLCRSIICVWDVGCFPSMFVPFAGKLVMTRALTSEARQAASFRRTHERCTYQTAHQVCCNTYSSFRVFLSCFNTSLNVPVDGSKNMPGYTVWYATRKTFRSRLLGVETKPTNEQQEGLTPAKVERWKPTSSRTNLQGNRTANE